MPKPPESKTFGVRADSDLIAAWKEEAAARGITVSEMIRIGVSLFCEKVPRPANPRFTTEELESGARQMKSYFNRLGLLGGEE